jgi:hypothetical protein
MGTQRRSGTFEHPNALRLRSALSGLEGWGLWHWRRRLRRGVQVSSDNGE